MSRKAFIFGSDYKGSEEALQSCVADCTRISEALKSKSFTVEPHWSDAALDWPKIQSSLTAFVKSLKSGDKAIVYYSGHGLQVKDNNGDEEDGNDEAVYTGNEVYVRDDDLRSIFQLAVAGVKLLVVFDCCHSGSMLDLPYRINDMALKKESNFTFRADIICISGCFDTEVSYEARGTGFLTDCFVKLLTRWSPKINPSMPWMDFYIRLSSDLIDLSNNAQFPRISFSNYNVLKTMWL